MSEYQILKKAFTGGKITDIFIVDCHGHLGLWKDSFPFKVEIEVIIQDMDRIGIDVVCLNKFNCPDIKLANDDIGKAVKSYPDRVVGFAATVPSLGKENTEDELKRCFDELGFKGIKVHEGYDTFYLRDQVGLPEYQSAVESIWEFAAEKRCSVLCHGLITPEVAKRYPEAIFIIAHAGGDRRTVWRYADQKNVYFDTAASSTLRGNIEWIVEKVGVERVLYGSDLPYANPAYRIGQVIGTRLKDEVLRKILGENMANILKKE